MPMEFCIALWHSKNVLQMILDVWTDYKSKDGV